MNAVQVARELGVNERTIRRAISDGRIRATKRGRSFDLDIDDARRVFGPDAPTIDYQEALAEALYLMRGLGNEADALDLERRYGIEYVEPRPRVRLRPRDSQERPA